ncbi:MAG: ferrous iron transport protein B [Chitinivibrionales bacterium]|nr:ferrous iron transport protein B [Chitinivibrionales bacterium]
MIRIALVGQPNCGKSTLFNSVAGYKAITANFPGTTIEYLSSDVRIDEEEFTLIDLPGIYSLSSPESEEILCRRCLQQHLDAIVHVIDASVLSRSIELTLELLDHQVPMVVCLNMMDESHKKGIEIDIACLSQELAVPVLPTIATKGQGIAELFKAALVAARSRVRGKELLYSHDVEVVVSKVQALLAKKNSDNLGTSPRLLSLKLLENDPEFKKVLFDLQPGLADQLKRLQKKIADSHGRPSEQVIASERHALAMNLCERVAKVRSVAAKPWQERLDQVVMHPQWGYLLLVAVLCGLFFSVFTIGKELERPLLLQFERLSHFLNGFLENGSFLFAMVNGLIQGFTGGIGIALPYLVPFLIGLSLLEDVGYLPRAAFLIDFIMHRLGLHGKSIIAFVLSYGCNVPAIMAARMLEKPRDRFITATLSTFIPCAARTTIIFGIIGFFIGPIAALLLYVFNVIVIAAAGTVIARLLPEKNQGAVLEIPPYRLPKVSNFIKKIWFRLKEFIVIAWPLLIVGSLILSFLDYFRLSGAVNSLLSPLVNSILGLPREVGIALVFGILRKELTLVMLVQVMGTHDFSAVMTRTQMLVFTVFSVFYIPCLATLGVLRAVVGVRGMIFILVFTTGFAVALAFCMRLVLALFSLH